MAVPVPPSEADQRGKALQDFVVQCTDLTKLERLIGRFNIFDVLKSAHNEIRHSNVLAWLFDPSGSHGMDDLFLRRWLMRVLHEIAGIQPLDPVDVDTCEFRSVTVRREWHHIDLLIEITTDTGKRWTICIENKVYSLQTHDQLERYHALVSKAYPNADALVFVFLSVGGEEPNDPRFHITTYKQVADVLADCLGHPTRRTFGSRLSDYGSEGLGFDSLRLQLPALVSRTGSPSKIASFWGSPR